jgi:rubrerythrin
VPKPLLSLARPDLSAQWHPTRNDSKTPESVTTGAGFRAWWLCPVCGHEWVARVIDRALGQGCGPCKLEAKRGPRDPAPGESFGDLFPHLLDEYAVEKNALDPYRVMRQCVTPVHWVCRECGMPYMQSFAGRARTRSDGEPAGCGPCGVRARRAKTIERNLAMAVPLLHESLVAIEPEVAGEWHPTLNTVTPAAFFPGARESIHWLCRSCSHTWTAKISSRTGSKRTGCPKCFKGGRSRIETDLIEALHTRGFTFAHDGRIPNTITTSTTKRWKVDLLDEATRTVIEYDGAYWHGPQSPSRRNMRIVDLEKSADLRAQGWHLIRVREAPLSALHPDDIVVPHGATGESIAALVAPRLDRLAA